MFARVTQLEIDSPHELEEAVGRFEEEVAPGLRRQDGFAGAVVLAKPDGNGTVITLWDEEEAAADAYEDPPRERPLRDALPAPPGREVYEVLFSELPAGRVGSRERALRRPAGTLAVVLLVALARPPRGPRGARRPQPDPGAARRPERRAPARRSALIVLGLMLGTTIMRPRWRPATR